jgi:hypothetical protein
MSEVGVVDFLDFGPPTCGHGSAYEKDCVACAVRILNFYLPASMRLYVESKPGHYEAGAADRDGFFRVVASGLTPAEALVNLRNPLALIAFMEKTEVHDDARG